MDPPQEQEEEIEDPIDLMNEEELDRYVEQFRRQLKMHREQVSVVVEDMKAFCLGEMGTDPLIKGMDSKTNPYIEKKDCHIH